MRILAKQCEIVFLLLLISGCTLTVGTNFSPQKGGEYSARHVVRKGENLFRIAQYYYATASTEETLARVEKIKRANNLSGEQLSLGQKLNIPGSSKSQPSYALTPPGAPGTAPRISPVIHAPEAAGPDQPTVSIIKEDIFIWPASGKIICRYGELGNKGIDILVKPESKITASRDGSVEYVGSTAKYGETLILKHDDGYYTVYGHDASFRISKDRKVKKGEVIGEIKKGDTKLRYLHFEIRKEAQTLDPLACLPPVQE